MTKQYRPKLSSIEAMQWDSSLQSIQAICAWINNGLGPDDEPWLDYETQDEGPGEVYSPIFHGSDGLSDFNPQDWVCRISESEPIRLSDELFKSLYEEA